ncbi:MAG: L-arabinose transport system permease protein [Verrucomicrobiota bacterium]|nr:L-arabinose transport system permease protein [Verrucomicrobiota bacterium]
MTSKPLSSPSPFARLWGSAGMLVVLAVLLLICSLFVENFLTVVNLRGLALAVATIGMVACTMMFCLAAGDFDLSVGSVVAFAGVLGATVMNSTGSVAFGVAAALASGALIGFTNGVFVARLGINALITTLASMQIVRGLGFIASDGRAVGIRTDAFFALGNTAWLGVPVPVWLTAACFTVFGVLLNLTAFGRNALAIGGNKEAAHLAGVAVTRIKITIFTLQGLVAAFAGLVLAARMTSGQPNTSQGLELEVISACVLGGVSLTGGVARISAVIAGVLIMGIVQNAMNLLNIPPFYQYVARGLILLGAVMLDRFKQRT